MLHAVIIAGGTGTRFWPRSTRSKPKQFLELFGDRSMLQATVDRLDPLIPKERIWVITNKRYESMVRDQLPEVPSQQVVGEPVGRNTAPCVALASALLEIDDPDAVMAVLPADHLISDPEEFRRVLETAGDETDRNPESLVTIGIRPDRPETGYGYIEFQNSGDKEEAAGKHPVWPVRQFREKPDLETARRFVESGNFLWNSGMFVWRAETIRSRFAEYLPDIARQLETLQSELSAGNKEEGIRDFYENCPSISIDYGIMEKAGDVRVVPGTFGWNDVGSWKAVYELKEKERDGNVIQSEAFASVASGNNLIHSESGKIIALVGLEDTAVVETDDAILVCRMEHAQDVKKIVSQLKEDEEKRRFL